MNRIKTSLAWRSAPLLNWLLARLPDDLLKRVLLKAAFQRAESLPAVEGLRFILALENDLYPAEGELAKKYGGGMHTKHRHMQYEKFFTDNVKSGENVLDIGCGTGYVAYHLAKDAGAKVHGIDLSEQMLSVARERHTHPNVVYQQGNALKDLPRDRHFDVVVLSNVLEHLPDRPEFLRKVVAANKPDRFLIRVPLFERDWRVPLKQELGLDWRLDPTHETEYTLETFHQEMKEASLEIKSLQVRWGEIWAELKPAHA